jgi:hypothetical protein
MYNFFHIKYPLFLSDFNETYFLEISSNNPQMQNFMKICLVRTELFHEDQQTWWSCSLQFCGHTQKVAAQEMQFYYRCNVFVVVTVIPSSAVLSHCIMWQMGTNICAECTASIFTLCSSHTFVPPYQTTTCCHNTEGHDLYQISYQYTATPLLLSVCKWRVITRCRQDKDMCVSRTYTEDCAARLTFILLMWTFGRAPNYASKWEMGFNSVA